MEVLLDGRLMTCREAVHDILTEKLNLPVYYGRNLDALYDVLSSYPENVKIMLIYPDAMRDSLGRYANALVNTITDAAVQNPKVNFLISFENN